MPTKLPDAIKPIVIKEWLEGKPRDEIAHNNGLSGGTITNIINEWRQGLGLAASDELREFAITLRKVGISPAQCALGFRVAINMINLGVKEENFESFIRDIYNRCKDLPLSTNDIVSHLKDLFEFSRTVPLTQIPEYINQKNEEKKALEEEIKKLKEHVESLKIQSSNIEALRNEEIKSYKLTAEKLKLISHLKLELSKCNIPLTDIAKFAKVVNGIKQKGYDVTKVINEFSDLDRLVGQKDALQLAVANIEIKIKNLKQQNSSLEQIAYFHNQTLSVYHELDSMQFGLKQLKQLRSTIIEIGDANGLSPDQAAQKFFKDIEHDYDNKLGFESKVEKLRLEVSNLSQDQTRLRSETLAQPLVGPMLIRLIQRGVTDQDIVDIAHIVERHKTIGIDTQLLISELEKYCSIKSAIQESNKENDRLKMEQESLQIQKQDIHRYYQSIVFESIRLQNSTTFIVSR